MPMNQRRLLLLVAALATTSTMSACSIGAPPHGRGQGETAEEPAASQIDLVRTGACGDAYFWAESSAGDMAVTVEIADSRPAGFQGTMSIPFSLTGPSPRVDVRVLTGHDLSNNFCTDLPELSSEPEASEGAVAGEGTITIDPPPDTGNTCGRNLGSLHLSGLVSEAGIEFSPINLSSHDIGCYSG